MENIGTETTEIYKKRLLDLFSKFITFCDDFSLNYFCTGGTLLGAVRHHGFIPWDDDIDLFMMRNDYNRLISLKEKLQERGIGLEGIQCNDQFSVFLKIWDMNTTLWEIEEIPYVYGVFIDIFPLDFSDESKASFLKKYKKRRTLFMLYQLSHMRFSFKSLSRRIKQKDWKFISRNILSLVVPSFLRNIIRKALLNEDLENQKGDGSFLVSYYGDYWEREHLKRDWFEKTLIVNFEDLKVKIPVGYDEYLTQIYHDYMKLPPIEKQVTHHYHYFWDLDKHYTIEEIKRMKL